MASFTSSTFLLVGTAILGLVNASALPADLFSRTVSPDGSCGSTNGGYTCTTASEKCCSQWGWCGDTVDYCGTGCQAGFGLCGSGTVTSSSVGASTPTPTSTSAPASTTTPAAGGRSRPGSVPYAQLINSCTVPGTVALTFDDGPYIYTSELLDILKANSVHCTFFVNGQNWGDPITSTANQALMKRMDAEGHQIGSHSWSHPHLSSLSASAVTSQMTMVESALMSSIGKYPTYMRPPYFDYGGSCMSVMDSLSYHVIIADLDPLDYQNTANITPSRNTFANAINSSNAASGKFLVLNHDVYQTTVEQLVQYEIDTAKAKGFRLVTVGECLGDPAANWYRTA